MASYKITGMGFGDCGKGSIVSYLAHNNPDIKIFSKYNGGCQAKHTIESNGKTFSFAQMSSGMLSGGDTYLTDNFVINLFNLIEEIKEYVRFTRNVENVEIEDVREILSRIYIDEACLLVTPFHKILNIYDELMMESPRGSVGTGVSIAKKLDEVMPTKSIKAKDIYNEKYISENLKKQHALLATTITQKILNQIKEKDEAICEYISYFMSEEGLASVVSSFNNFTKDFKLNIVKNTVDFLKTKDVIYEASQGVLIDKKYGIKPNTTYLDTTNNSLKNTDAISIGVIRAYYTRHGQGVFPTEDENLNKIMSDGSQEVGKFNGKIRFGWFDAVLFRYACKVNPIDEVYITCLDNLFAIGKAKVCASYYYEGEINNTFKEIFEYEKYKNGYKIINILKNDNKLGLYLNKCKPIYKEISIGKNDFVRYLGLIDSEINVPIRLISLGSALTDKITILGDIVCSKN